jgi:hypothetical protein
VLGLLSPGEHPIAVNNKNNKFLSRIVFIGWANFHTFGRANRHDCVIWGREPPREYLQRERDSPKLNVCCALTYEIDIGPFSFEKNIITSNLFLDILENLAIPQVKNDNNFILQLDGAPVHFFSYCP